MSPLERLLAEEWPDGHFAGPRPRPQPRPWTPEEQAQHATDLLNALDGWSWDEPERRRTRNAA